MQFLTKFVKRPRDNLSHNAYSEDKKETLKIIRPLVDLQAGSLKVKESSASFFAVAALKGYSLVKNFKNIARIISNVSCNELRFKFK